MVGRCMSKPWAANGRIDSQASEDCGYLLPYAPVDLSHFTCSSLKVIAIVATKSIKAK
jgi:hypothetical protein